MPLGDSNFALELSRRNWSFPDPHGIARAEFARQRRRLGNLTQDQEVSIEKLLASTANRISDLIGKVLKPD